MHAGRLYPNHFALQFASIRSLQEKQGVLSRSTCLSKLSVKNIVLVGTYGKSSFVIKQSSSGHTVEIRESLLCLHSHWKKLHRGSQHEKSAELAHNLPHCLKTWGWDRWGPPCKSCRGWEYSGRSPAAAEPGKGSSSVPAARRAGNGNLLRLQDDVTYVDIPHFTQGLWSLLIYYYLQYPKLFNSFILAKTMTKPSCWTNSYKLLGRSL